MKNKKFVSLMLAFIFLVILGATAFAAEGSGAAATGTPLTEKLALFLSLGAIGCIVVAAAFGITFQSLSLRSAIEGIARNPSAADKIITPTIIGLAMIESLVIYALIIALMLVLKVNF